MTKDFSELTDLMDALRYKDQRKKHLRREAKIYRDKARDMVQIGRPDLAIQFLSIAQSYQKEVVYLGTTTRSSIDLWKDDQKRQEQFESLYPDTVELFA